jgi:hypothetical protein
MTHREPPDSEPERTDDEEWIELIPGPPPPELKRLADKEAAAEARWREKHPHRVEPWWRRIWRWRP